MLYKIKKNRHFSFNFPKLLWNKNSISISFSFDSSVIYKINDTDQLDWNKLFGFSKGFHHKNSARIVWRWNPYLEKIEITKYYYINKKRIIDENIILLDPNQFITIELEFPKDIKTTRWGYLLFPYFGGNQKAPHDIKICLKYEL